VVLLGVVVGLALGCEWRRAHVRQLRPRLDQQLLEWATLAIGSVVLLGWPLLAPLQLGRLEELSDGSPQFAAGFLWVQYIGAAAFLCLFIMRVLSSETAVLFGWFGIIAVCFGRLFWSTAAAKFQTLRGNDDLGLLNNTLLVPAAFMALRLFVWAALTLMGGFYFSAVRFRYWLFLPGCIVSGLLFRYLLMPWWIWPRWWISPISFAVFGLLMVRLPIQGMLWSRIFGVSVVPGQSSNRALGTRNYAAHLAVLMLGVFVAFSAAVNYFEREQARMYAQGAEMPLHNPSERNAYQDLESSVLVRNPVELDQLEEPANFRSYRKLLDEITSESRAELLSDTGWEGFRLYDTALREYTQSLEKAARADYLWIPLPDLRALARCHQLFTLIAIRSQLAIHGGRTLDAANDIRTLYGASRLFLHQPWSEIQDVSIQARNAANGAAYNALIQLRGNEGGLLALKSALDAVADLPAGLDWESLRRGEGGIFGIIAPNADNTLLPGGPTFLHAHRSALLSAVNSDLVRIAAALELFHIQSGEYPDELQDITPAYLQRLPVDPIDGEPYTYSRQGEDYKLSCPSVPESWIEDLKLSKPLKFPLSQSGR
jgi:hypothetical protein